MLRSVILFVFLITASPALASGDFSCDPSWTLSHTQRSDCDNQPFLSPGNDSRVNLQLLLLDAGQAKLHPPAPPKDTETAAPVTIGASASPFTLEDFNGLLVPAAAPGTDEASDRADGEGSRCNSNAAGAQQFQAALDQARGLPATEKTALAQARGALAPNCDDASKASAPPPSVPIKSGPGKQFAAYLAGATAFYAGDYDRAHDAFAGLKDSNQPWLKQTARYMLGRVEVNRAQANAFDSYGVLDLSKVDAKAAAAAEAGFKAYLRDYPRGDYAISAKGLLRRVDWLAGQPEKLAAEYAGQFAIADPAARTESETDLVQEADNKLLTDVGAGEARDPILLAAWDLMQMRTASGDNAPKPITLAALQAQRPVFAGHEALFDYLLAAHALFDDHDPAAALNHVPATAPTAPLSYLAFSRQVVRGLALEAAKDSTGARRLWLDLLPAAQGPLQPPMVELALAMNDERGGKLADVFAPGSPIHDADVRAILLRNGAGPQLLRDRAKAATSTEPERQVALTTLLYKELTRGRYQAFVGDLALLPPAPPSPEVGQPDPDEGYRQFRWTGGEMDYGYTCPGIAAIARALVAEPHSARSLLCLDEFVRVNGLDDDPLDVPPPAADLGGAPSQFPGGQYSRLESYKQILADPKAGPNERAYTLYRAIYCYASSGANHCTGPGVPLEQRKQWFRMLKTQYAKTTWAQELKYYW